MFYSSTKNDFINDVLSNANSDLLLESVCADISKRGEFDMCNLTGDALAVRFKNFVKSKRLEVVAYKPLYRFSKAYGYFSRNKPFTIHVNQYKFYNLSLAAAVGLLYHESGHAMDNHDRDCNCHHGNNSPAGKSFTFQYSLNRFVRGYYGIDEPKPIKLSLWSRVKSFFRKVF